jgi:hypothetical protein
MEIKRKESTAREILVAATVDAMKKYVSQVLIPAKLIDEDTWRHTDGGTGSDLCNRKYAIANDIAGRWEKGLEARIGKAANNPVERTASQPTGQVGLFGRLWRLARGRSL